MNNNKNYIADNGCEKKEYVAVNAEVINFGADWIATDNVSNSLDTSESSGFGVKFTW